MTGRVPAGYTVLQRLGAGRTALVWLARDLGAGRDVALKLPRPELTSDPVLRRMFENEVQITLNLDHPHVVRAYAGRPTGDDAFLALEYCSGGTLDQLLLERGRLPLETALRLVLDVAKGLAHTHDRSVLHRDVKPANVFIDGEGRAKLGDFGTGTFRTDDVDERVGTAFYMAPEVFEGRPTSIRSDVYSLGVLAYEVIGGERPFVGASYEALMVAHTHSLPRDRRGIRPELPVAVARVVAKGLSRDPERRFADATTFLAAFRDAVGGRVVDAPASTPPPEAAVGRGGARRTEAPAAPPADDRSPERPGESAPRRRPPVSTVGVVGRRRPGMDVRQS